MRKFTVYWLPVLVWMIVIFAFSSRSDLPKMPEPLLQTVIAKAAHISEYAILAILLFRAFGQAEKGKAIFSARFQIALLATIAYGASDEFHQSFTPGRTPSPIDVMIDSFGALLGLSIVHILLRTVKAPALLRLIESTDNVQSKRK